MIGEGVPVEVFGVGVHVLRKHRPIMIIAVIRQIADIIFHAQLEHLEGRALPNGVGVVVELLEAADHAFVDEAKPFVPVWPLLRQAARRVP